MEAGVFGARTRAGVRERRPRTTWRAAVAALASAFVVAGMFTAVPAYAIPPFPISDNTTGTPGTVNPNWLSARVNNTVGNTYTSDGWLRLTSNGLSQATNILNNTAFPSSTGFQVSFDYRMAGGTRYDGKPGDGLAFYLVDGTQTISAGAPGSGLGYARGRTACGVVGGYLGVGLDVFGNFAKTDFDSFGGQNTLASPLVAIRGSGPGTCTGAANTQYPWATGRSVAGLWTGVVGSTADPATQAASLYRRVTVTVNPNAIGSVNVTVALSESVAKTQQPSTMTQVLAYDLERLPGQVDLPSTIKLGFSASTGLATDYHDIRGIRVSALTDAAITKTISSTTPSHAGYPAGTYLPGDPIEFVVNAQNNGPTTIGNAPNGVAHVFDDLSSLPISGVTWTCTAAGGAACVTPGGSGSTVLQRWTGPQGGAVTLRIRGTVTAASGQFTNTAVVPTNFTSNTVDPALGTVQQDGGAADTNLTNNTATATFRVFNPQPALSLVKTANPTAVTAAGELVDYSFAVTNSGNVPVSALQLTETAFTGTGAAPVISCPTTALAVGASTTCTASYRATQADIDAGQISNTATATATPVDGPTPTSPAANAVVTATPQPLLTLVKSVSPSAPGDIAVGTDVVYSFVATNAGNVTLSAVTVAESAFSGSGGPLSITCPPGPITLAPGEQIVCTAPYEVTQADVNVGVVANTATATATRPGGATVNAVPAAAALPAEQNPSVSLVKASSPVAAEAGEVVTYSFLVTNTGNVTISDVAIDEGTFTGSGPLSAITCPATSLVPGEQTTCTATYTLMQADVDAGELQNTATATADDSLGEPIASGPSTDTLPLTAVPGLTVTKSATPSDAASFTVGRLITYSFLVTNTGNVTIDGIAIDETEFSGSEPMSAIACPQTSLAPDASTTCTATYTVTQADVDAGMLVNTATAVGDTPGDVEITSEPSTTSVPSDRQPALTLQKSAVARGATAGSIVDYTFLLTNSGNVTLNAVGVDETGFTGTGTMSAVSCPGGALLPGAQRTCTATYALTQADVDAGVVDNVAVATATPPAGAPISSESSDAVVFPAAAPALTLRKSASPSDAASFTVGRAITYTFVATNTGNVTLDDLVVSDTDFSGAGTLSPITCATGSLAPGAQRTCTATYTLVQEDIDAGQVLNTGSASATTPGGASVDSPPASARIPVDQAPAISFAKTASPSTVTAAGQVVTYTFLVSNVGNVSVSSVAIDETTFSGTGAPLAITCPGGALLPGQRAACTATYTVTQADLDAGTITNTASARATGPDAAAVTSLPSTATVTADANPALTLVKSVSPETATAAGAVVTYSFLATNSGNVTLTGLAIDEQSFTGSGTAPVATCPVTSLAPAASTTCTATYTLTQADVDTGSVENSARATAEDPGGADVASPTSSVELAVVGAASLSIVKSVSPSAPADLEEGGEVLYSFVVTNTGDVTLTDVAVAEGTFTGSGDPLVITCPPGPLTLAPGAQVICEAPYVLTQEDIDADSVENTATASGRTPSGRTIESDPSQAVLPAEHNPSLSLKKTASSVTAAVGEVVTYSFAVTNTGNVTLTGVAIDETAFSGTSDMSAITCPLTRLIPGQATTCTATYALTQADVDAGELSNTATATATDTDAGTVTSPSSTAVVPLAAAGALTVEKSGVATQARAGATVAYSFLVRNTGNVTLSALSVSDSSFSGTGTLSAITCPVTTLAPNGQTTCAASYTLTQADVDAGGLENTAAAAALDPDETTVTSPDSTAEVPLAAAPAITVVKSATPTDAASFTVGREITYTFLLTNTGNVTLTDVAPVESSFSGSGTMSTPSCLATTLAPAAQTTCTATYVLTQVDVDAGTLANTASATATPPAGDPVSAPSSTVTLPGDPQPTLHLVKIADRTTVTAAGQVIAYTFTATNTGNITLREVAIDEVDFSGTGAVVLDDCAAATLAPGAQLTCTAQYRVHLADLTGARLSNTAVAHAESPSGVAVSSAESTAAVETEQAVFPPTGASGLGWPLAAALLLLFGGGALMLFARRGRRSMEV